MKVCSQNVEKLISSLDPITSVFSKAGFNIYLVGGIVRDILSGKQELSNDIDLTTDACPSEVKELLRKGGFSRVYDVGEAYGTIGLNYDGKNFEITTHRGEIYRRDSRKPLVSFSSSIEEDLSRRDFTINAMALKLPELNLIDPYGGEQDLRNKLLRTPREPDLLFLDDPLRMLRAARFISQLDFNVTPEIFDSALKLSGRLEIVARERIRQEFDKLILGNNTRDALWFLVKTKLIDQFIPEIPALLLEQDPVHKHKDVLSHTIEVVAGTRADKILRLAALFHDVGKPATKKITDKGVTFYHHDIIGAKITASRMRELSYKKEEIRDVSTLVRLHLRFHTYRFGWSDSALRRYVRDAGNLLEKLNELTRADCTTRNESKRQELIARLDDFEKRLADLKEKEALNSVKPELNGTQVMELLNLKPSKEVGEALKWLLEVRLEEGLLGQEEISKRLKQWYGNRSKN